MFWLFYDLSGRCPSLIVYYTSILLGSYNITMGQHARFCSSDQPRLRLDCAEAQSRLSLCCLHTQRWGVSDGLNQKSRYYNPQYTCAYVFKVCLARMRVIRTNIPWANCFEFLCSIRCGPGSLHLNNQRFKCKRFFVLDIKLSKSGVINSSDPSPIHSIFLR